MNMTHMKPLLFTLSLTVLAGCPGLGSEAPQSTLDEVPEFPSFDLEIKLLLDVRCNECHGETARRGAPDTFRLDVFADVGGVTGAQSRAALSDLRINNASNPMPPTSEPQMTDIEKETFKRWIECGTPETLAEAEQSCPSEGDPEPDPQPTDVPLELNFNDRIKPVVEARCNFPSCHAADDFSGGISFASLETMQEATNAAFIPCDAENSTLIQRIKLEAGNPLLMPVGGPPLDAETVAIFEEWINEGTDVTPLCEEQGVCGNFEICRQECADPNTISCFVGCTKDNSECTSCVTPALADCAREFCDEDDLAEVLGCFEDCILAGDPSACLETDCSPETFQKLEDCMTPIIRNRNCNEQLEECGVRVLAQ